MADENRRSLIASWAFPEPPEVEVMIEIPRGSFLKRGSTGHIDFVSPLPCPFNYGSVPAYVGLEGDLSRAAHRTHLNRVALSNLARWLE